MSEEKSVAGDAGDATVDNTSVADPASTSDNAPDTPTNESEDTNAVENESEAKAEDQNIDSAFDYLEEEEVDTAQPSQVDLDAQGLANKWDSLTPEEQESRLNKLESRPKTLDALNTLLEEKKSNADMSQDQMRKELELRTQQIKEELKKEFKPHLIQADQTRLNSELIKFAKHNNLNSEVLKEISDPLGEVSDSFGKLKFDPETGKELSFNKRLELSLRGSEAVQNAIIESKSVEQAGKILKGVKMKMVNGSGGSVKKDLDSLHGQDWIDEADRLAAATQKSRYS